MYISQIKLQCFHFERQIMLRWQPWNQTLLQLLIPLKPITITKIILPPILSINYHQPISFSYLSLQLLLPQQPLLLQLSLHLKLLLLLSLHLHLQLALSALLLQPVIGDDDCLLSMALLLSGWRSTTKAGWSVRHGVRKVEGRNVGTWY